MKSVRLGAALAERLKRAAALAGVSESTLIREAVAARCDKVLGTSLYEQAKPFLGVVQGGGKFDAGDASEIFGEMLEEELTHQQEEARLRRSS